MRLDNLSIGEALPVREHTPSNVSLFLYNAAVWNAHRIHYDEVYTKSEEGHPGVVIDGPLQGDWLSQCVSNWIGDSGRVESFFYSNRKATYLGETLNSGGKITSIEVDTRKITVELWIKNSVGEITSPGGAVVVLS